MWVRALFWPWLTHACHWTPVDVVGMKSPKFQVVTEFHWMSVDAFWKWVWCGDRQGVGKCMSFILKVNVAIGSRRVPAAVPAAARNRSELCSREY